MRPPRVDATRIGSKKIEFQLELRYRFDALQELDDFDIMSETITDMILKSASRVAKEINGECLSQLRFAVDKPHKTTRALITKRREMAEYGDNKQRIK